MWSILTIYISMIKGCATEVGDNGGIRGCLEGFRVFVGGSVNDT